MSIPANIKKFRSAIIPGAIFVFVCGMTGAFCLIVIIQGWHFDFHALAIVTVVEVIYSFFASLMMSFVFPVGFSADGIYGHSFWGRRRFVSWQQIVTARTFGLFKFRFLRVYSADCKVTWLALFQSHDAEFRDEIRRLAPPSSPVLQFL